MTIVTFFVPGIPVAKGRPRMTKGGIAFTPKKTRNYEAYVRLIAQQSMGTGPHEGPVTVDILAVFPVAKSWPKWKKEMASRGTIAHTSKPDEDNIGKAISDAMNEVVYADDSQIVAKMVRKEYTRGPHRPGVLVIVKEAKGYPCQIKTRPQNG